MLNWDFFAANVSPSPLATEKGLTKGKIAGASSAPNLPPLNHGTEMAGALPPLNHNIEKGSSLPPLNHGKEEAANLPPLLHGIEQAGNLPPLNHGNDALQGFNSLPPLNHATEQAGNLPPLNHGIENNGLPPLNHANEQAGILPPLLHGVEQAGHAPSLSDFEKESTQNVDPLSAFTSQVENALSNNGKQSYTQLPLDLNGVGKDAIVMPKAGVKQSLPKSEDDLLRNVYKMKPVVQGKEFIDQQPFVPNANKVAVDDSGVNRGTLVPESVESAQSKDSVPSAYNDKEELQNLLTADQMSQGNAISTATSKFENQEPSGTNVLSDI